MLSIINSFFQERKLMLSNWFKCQKLFRLFYVMMKKFSENVIILNKSVIFINSFFELKFFQLLLMRKNNCHYIKISLTLISLMIVFAKLSINNIKYIIKIVLSRFLFFLQSFIKWLEMIEDTVVYEKHNWQ